MNADKKNREGDGSGNGSSFGTGADFLSGWIWGRSRTSGLGLGLRILPWQSLLRRGPDCSRTFQLIADRVVVRREAVSAELKLLIGAGGRRQFRHGQNRSRHLVR